MTTRAVYNFEALLNAINRDNAVLLNNYDKVTRRSKNKIIEVKSTWTYKCKEDNIQEKADATKGAGYEYEVWIYDSKGNKIVK